MANSTTMTTTTITELLNSVRFGSVPHSPKMKQVRSWWSVIGGEWQTDEVLKKLCSDDTVMDALVEAIETSDAEAMAVLTDRAEEMGVNPELCRMTREGLKKI